MCEYWLTVSPFPFSWTPNVAAAQVVLSAAPFTTARSLSRCLTVWAGTLDAAGNRMQAICPTGRWSWYRAQPLQLSKATSIECPWDLPSLSPLPPSANNIWAFSPIILASPKSWESWKQKREENTLCFVHIQKTACFIFRICGLKWLFETRPVRTRKQVS